MTERRVYVVEDRGRKDDPVVISERVVGVDRETGWLLLENASWAFGSQKVVEIGKFAESEADALAHYQAVQEDRCISLAEDLEIARRRYRWALERRPR